MIKKLLMFSLAGAGAFYISYHHTPGGLNHGYQMAQVEAVNAVSGEAVAEASGYTDKPVHYKYSTAADVFPSYLPGEKK